MSAENQEQIDYWNDRAGATWAELQERLDALLAPLSMAGLSAANVRRGERVLDVGCGCGDTSIALKQMGANVLGVDVSQPMLDQARQRDGSVDYLLGDAAETEFAAEFDLVFSRFGVMFFSDPFAAFKNIRQALKPGGRMLFVCWQPPTLNPWMAIAGRAIAPFLPVAEEPANPRAPGPFAFADRGYVTKILSSGGFSEIHIEPHTEELKLADTLTDAVYFQTRVGPAARVMSELEGEGRRLALAAVEEALRPFDQGEGLHLGSAVWLVSAKA